MSGRSKFFTWGLPAAGFTALAIGVYLVATNRPVIPQESPPRQPTTAPRTEAGVDAKRFIGGVGVSEAPGESIALAAHTPGIVTDVPAKLNAEVKVGDPLFTIDNRRLTSILKIRSSQLASRTAERAALAAQVPVRRAAVAAARAKVKGAEAKVREAKIDIEDRRNRLGIAQSVDDPRAISKEEVDGRRFSVAMAESQLASANADLLDAQAVLSQAVADVALLLDPETGEAGPDLLASDRLVEQAQAEVESAAMDLELLTVRSPIDGRVIQVNLRRGEYASASAVSDGLVVLSRKGAIHLRVQIDEVDIPRFDKRAGAWASPRGAASKRYPLDFVLVEPLVTPKQNLSSRTSERIDTRVLEVVYRFRDASLTTIGQQFDVYVATDEKTEFK